MATSPVPYVQSHSLATVWPLALEQLTQSPPPNLEEIVFQLHDPKGSRKLTINGYKNVLPKLSWATLNDCVGRLPKLRSFKLRITYAVGGDWYSLKRNELSSSLFEAYLTPRAREVMVFPA